MISIEFTEEAIKKRRYERFHHPHPRVQRKMEALLLKSQGIAHRQICAILGISDNTLRSYLRAYREGGATLPDLRGPKPGPHCPPQAQGRGITNGPVPFLFGAKAEQLKARYWVRIITPPEAKKQIWPEAYPKQLADAQDFQKVEIILAIGRNDAMPTAIQIYLPGGRARTVYTLSSIKANQVDPRLIFQYPFTARIPPGWQKIVDPAGFAPNAAQPRPAQR